MPELIEKYYEVYFTNDYSDVTRPTPSDMHNTPTILILPANKKWNDFGYECKCNFYVKEKNGTTIYQDELLLGFVTSTEEGKVSPYREDGRKSKYYFSSLTSADQLPIHFTMLGGIDKYRKLVSKLDLMEAHKILEHLNDLVYKKSRKSDASWLSEARTSEIFTLAFMRPSENYFAFHNAWSVLLGLDKEQIGDITKDYVLNINPLTKKTDELTRINMHFDPMSILPKRINVLIGKNGLGKSRTLNTIVQSLLEDSSVFRQSDGGRPVINRVLAIATPGETEQTFPKERKNSPVLYRRLILNREGQRRDSRGFGDMCVQLARSDEYIFGITRWNLLWRNLTFLKDDDELVVEIERMPTTVYSSYKNINNKVYVPLRSLVSGGEQSRLELWNAVKECAIPYRLVGDSVYPLSSGEQSFLKFAIQACLFIENGTLVLLDEPETHLHPNLITNFIQLLDSILEATGSLAIIATHSAYLVREVPKTQVLVFKESESGNLTIINPRLNTFGAEIGTISYFVFEDDIASVLADNILKKLSDLDENLEEIYLSFRDELAPEVQMYLNKKLGLNFEED